MSYFFDSEGNPINPLSPEQAKEMLARFDDLWPKPEFDNISCMRLRHNIIETEKE